MRRTAALIVAAFAAAWPAAAQTTWCSPVGNTVMCNTTPAPQVNTGLQQSMGMFGAALGERLAERRQAGAEQGAVKEVQAFAADPAHPYFGIVRDDMAALLQNGGAHSLQEAYDKSVYGSVAVALVRGLPKK